MLEKVAAGCLLPQPPKWGAGFMGGPPMQSGSHHFFLDNRRASKLSQSKEKLDVASPQADAHDQNLSPTREVGNHTIIKRSLKRGITDLYF